MSQLPLILKTMIKNEKSNQFVSTSCGMMLWLALVGCTEPPTSEEQIIALLADDAPYHLVSEELFEDLGWALPDGGAIISSGKS